MPITPRGMDADTFNAPFGTMIDYVLVYKIAFQPARRHGDVGSACGRAYRRDHPVRGLQRLRARAGRRVQDRRAADRSTTPFPYVDYGTSSWCDFAGNFTGTTGTSTMNGRTGSAGNVGGVYITGHLRHHLARGERLRPHRLSARSTGTDCTTPGVGGGGQHARRPDAVLERHRNQDEGLLLPPHEHVAPGPPPGQGQREP